jgi:N-methylhydantoinase A
MRSAIDTGGTFTDCVGLQAGQLVIEKRLSTPQQPAQALLAGLEVLAQTAPLRTLTHGTTVATNALLERKLARTALITTAGFRDLLRIGRQNRPALYALHPQRPAPLIAPEYCFEIAERIGADGEVLIPLEAEAIATLLAQLPPDLEAVAVCLLFSYRAPQHEQRLGEALRARGLEVSLSSEILPEYREYERFSTTVANATLQPIMRRYLAQLAAGLGALPCRLIQSNGGSLALAEAAQQPVRCVLSGPAGGLIGAREISRQLQIPQLLTFDMGGTSTDVALLNGALPLHYETVINGIPLKLPLLAIHTVGAGGGSCLSADAGGALRVGPESAGADPGPFCYGTGTRLTVTDAQLLLGRLPADAVLAGQLTLRTAGLAEAFAHLGAPLGLSAQAVALGAIAVANARMERALRVVSVESGQNPAEYTLLCFGGAGGLHACELAESLGMARVIVPAHAGVFSAWGMLFAPEVRDYSRTVWGALSGAHALAEAFAPLEAQAARDFGSDLTGLNCLRQLDLRYPGQSYELTVDWSPTYAETFHARHQELHHFSRPETPPEVVTIRLRVSRPLPDPEPLQPPPVVDHAAPSLRAVVFAQGTLATPFYQRAALKPAQTLNGPAVILEATATTLVPPGWQVQRDAHGHLHLSRRSKIVRDL